MFPLVNSRVQDQLLQPNCHPTRETPQTYPEQRIASVDAKLTRLWLSGVKYLIVGLNPGKFIEGSPATLVVLWAFLTVFYLAYTIYQITVAICFARNSIEVITNLYIATYLGAFCFQWAYLYLAAPKMFKTSLQFKDFQCANSCPDFADKTVDEHIAYMIKIKYIGGAWLGTNVVLHCVGPVVEAVFTLLRGGTVESFFILPQVFQLPLWGQLLMYFWNAITTGALMFWCIGSYLAIGTEVAKIKILCEILNEALENASDTRHLSKYVSDHVRIINSYFNGWCLNGVPRKAKELTQHLSRLNIFVFISGYLEFATQMYIVTFFDVNMSYYIALVYDMSSIFLLVASPCFMASEITFALRSVAKGSYSGKWYEGHEGLSKHVILMTQISQNSPEQTILLGSLKVERAAALALLRSSYAAYTVLMMFQPK